MMLDDEMQKTQKNEVILDDGPFQGRTAKWPTGVTEVNFFENGVSANYRLNEDGDHASVYAGPPLPVLRNVAPEAPNQP